MLSLPRRERMPEPRPRLPREHRSEPARTSDHLLLARRSVRTRRAIRFVLHDPGDVAFAAMTAPHTASLRVDRRRARGVAGARAARGRACSEAPLMRRHGIAVGGVAVKESEDGRQPLHAE
jgi:hypothetical protein